MSESRFASPRTARHYDSQLWLERAALDAALALAAPSREDRTLDLATGTGALLRGLARHPERPREVTGLDASAAMLARVPPPVDGWTLTEGDARRLPMADDSLDLVLCAYLIHLLEPGDRRRVLAEVARVLAPGGRVVLVSLLAPTGLAGRALLSPIQAALCRALGRGSGFCTCDPTPDLSAVGLRAVRGVIVTRGYRSLCLRAEPA